MSEVAQMIATAAPWLGLSLIAPIFLANAIGMLDQSVAVRELSAIGVDQPLARAMVGLGRLVQLVATPCLFFQTTRLVAALLLAVFLLGATYTAHRFWKAAPVDRDRQLANFLKNVAIVGGLLLAAGWST